MRFCACAGVGAQVEAGAGISTEDAEQEALDPHTYHGISQAAAAVNVELLRKYSRIILPKLLNLFEDTPAGLPV